MPGGGPGILATARRARVDEGITAPGRFRRGQGEAADPGSFGSDAVAGISMGTWPAPGRGVAGAGARRGRRRGEAWPALVRLRFLRLNGPRTRYWSERFAALVRLRFLRLNGSRTRYWSERFAALVRPWPSPA